MSTSSVINAGPPFQIYMHAGLLNVVFIPHESVEASAWWLFREYGLASRSSTGFSSISLDETGLTIVCDMASITSLECLKPSGMTISPQKWKAFVINVIGSATEVPGAICYLSDALSKEEMSILHISTYQSEVFLVQEQDVEKASKVFKKVDSPNQISSFLSNLSDMLHTDASGNVIRDGFELQVLPKHVTLARLSDQYSMEKISSALMKILLFDERYGSIEGCICRKKRLHKVKPLHPDNNGKRLEEPPVLHIKSDHESHTHGHGHTRPCGDHKDEISCKFLWGLWQCDDEVTLLLYDEDLKLFPEGSLVVSPQRWKVIKLCGRPIEFDETGIVSAMSRMEVNVSTLNISTATTNCALVPEDQLESSLQSLCTIFHCPFLYK